MAQSLLRSDFRRLTACCAVGISCMFLPQRIQSAIRAAALDALRPGQQIAAPILERTAGRDSGADRAGSSADDTRLRHELDKLRLALRRQELQSAELSERLDAAGRHGALPVEAQRGEPLLVRDLLTARVLGRESELGRLPALQIDLGTRSGAVAGAFVVRSNNPVLDQGAGSGVQPGQPVYAGRCVLGRVERAGSWTSLVQLITDKDYSGRAQLVRQTDDRSHFGAEGILAGHGDGTCRLTGVRYTEPVAVGDHVYTGGRSARFPYPMYYGRVIRAQLANGQRWEIVVEPAASVSDVREVAVLRQSVRTERVLGQ